MKYKYDVESEAFKRVDNRGKPLYVNIVEANRIIGLINLGHSVVDINNKITLSNPKGTVTTVNSFIRNYKADNIIMPENAPMPIHNFESITDSSRIDALEERVTKLEQSIMPSECECMDKNPKSLSEKVKSWLS